MKLWPNSLRSVLTTSYGSSLSRCPSRNRNQSGILALPAVDEASLSLLKATLKVLQAMISGLKVPKSPTSVESTGCLLFVSFWKLQVQKLPLDCTLSAPFLRSFVQQVYIDHSTSRRETSTCLLCKARALCSGLFVW